MPGDVDTALRAARTPTPPGLLTEVLHASFRWTRLNNALRVTLDEHRRVRCEWRSAVQRTEAIRRSPGLSREFFAASKKDEWAAFGAMGQLERRARRLSMLLETLEEMTERKVVRHG